MYKNLRDWIALGIKSERHSLERKFVTKKHPDRLFYDTQNIKGKRKWKHPFLGF
jgi:hypothetical protein